ncbi:MAG: hypothetical protein KGR26_02885 [Cyanobacteria bacterium REEB65]|nr:hypothetical protein [Cyanobacteria bacterium REEB65]
MAALMATACALLGVAASQVSFPPPGEVTLSGTVAAGPLPDVKVGLFRYFEGDDGSGGYSVPNSDHVTFTTVAAPDPHGSFTLVASSSHDVAEFLLFAWPDVRNNGHFDTGEPRSAETFLITKVGNAFMTTEATAGQIPPLATPSAGTWSDASKVNYRFTFSNP